MLLHHILVLAAVQGITEFLPISSSGHLIVTGHILGWPDQGLAMDIAVHIGTLFAVMIYFWRDVWQMTVGVGRAATGRGGPPVRLIVNVIVATIPVVIAGFFLKDMVETQFRSVELIGWTTLGFGIVLWIADHVGMTIRRIEHIAWPTALVIGLAQVLALVPGTSRSGITMTAARFLGLEREDAARFSMLISIPTIAGAGLLAGYDIYKAGDLTLTGDFVIAAGLSFATALIAIALMMAWLRRSGFGIFVLYRIALGGGLLYWAYSGATPL
ncbi:undecaprenyl-diphosphate phosphatase [Rhodospirillaceae bacterium KN72]|uniref:Undecaprenyl-diphosphatase n=1 Tax=Pacificispira spongiicola TaxID=2729598 RepID=A0A7Y0E0B9_9PROT|nr:undecaprenyl-diphosphate phosphatase [Pacificispira spongiicola]NMM44778.1 undecaprenyl-diphosphate phosphatase [Pacificispira spongiicola]